MPFRYPEDRLILSQKLASQLADYRIGEVNEATPNHVERWLSQIEESEDVKTQFLGELTHLFDRTYITRHNSEEFLKSLASNERLVGSDPAAFWSASCILSGQSRGSSQADLRALFDPILLRSTGVSIGNCQSPIGPFIYIDEAIFTGLHLITDITDWLPSAPLSCDINIISIASYSGGVYYADKRIREAARSAGKQVRLKFWRALDLENKSNEGVSCDVLRLREYPSDAASIAYMDSFAERKEPKLLRPGHSPTSSRLFTDETSKDLLERVFWKAGLRVRALCRNLPIMHRPLGYTSTNSENRLGFGSMLVTYRNCPNNAPLALWAGAPWYPLVPRRIN